MPKKKLHQQAIEKKSKKTRDRGAIDTMLLGVKKELAAFVESMWTPLTISALELLYSLVEDFNANLKQPKFKPDEELQYEKDIHLIIDWFTAQGISVVSEKSPTEWKVVVGKESEEELLTQQEEQSILDELADEACSIKSPTPIVPQFQKHLQSHENDDEQDLQQKYHADCLNVLTRMQSS